MLRSSLVTVLLLGSASMAQAQILTVDPATVTVTGLADFTSIAPDAGLTNRDDIIAFNGISFGERFAGLVSSTPSFVEGFTGDPTDPLTLVAGAANQNLAVSNEGAGGFVVGITPRNGGFPATGSLGEGMVAVQFQVPQFEVAFDLIGFDGQLGTSLVASFWRADGSYIGRAVRTSTIAVTTLAYRRTGSVADIAGMILVNSDTGGLGYNNFRFAMPTFTPPGETVVPEPGTWAMLIAGFGLVGAAGRRRRYRLSSGAR